MRIASPKRSPRPSNAGALQYRAGIPDALTPEFARDASKRRQWDAFVRELAARPDSLETVVSDLAAFLMPMAVKARALARSVD